MLFEVRLAWKTVYNPVPVLFVAWRVFYGGTGGIPDPADVSPCFYDPAVVQVASHRDLIVPTEIYPESPCS